MNDKVNTEHIFGILMNTEWLQELQRLRPHWQHPDGKKKAGKWFLSFSFLVIIQFLVKKDFFFFYLEAVSLL